MYVGQVRKGLKNNYINQEAIEKRKLIQYSVKPINCATHFVPM